MNCSLYATGWYSVTDAEFLAALGQYSRMIWHGKLINWDATDRRYVVS